MPKIDPDLREAVTKVTADLMAVGRDRLTDDAGLEELGMDSLDLVEILMGVEEEIGCDLGNDFETDNLHTFGDLLAAVQERACP